MTENYFAAWFVGEAKDSSTAKTIIECYKNCPHIYFMSQKEQRIYGIFLLSDKQKWWIEYVEQHPGKETLGFETISITCLDNISYPDTFYKQKPKDKSKISPCGSNCSICPQKNHCSCCPATIYYKE